MRIETVFKVEPPLEEISGGHGYMGVLLRDVDEDKLQCHICGKWRTSLSIHVLQAHKIKSREYKKKFGLPLSFPLISVGLSRKLHARSSSEKALEHLAKVRNIKALREKVSPQRRRSFMTYARNCMAAKNKVGLCKEQMERRYLMVADIVGKDPGQNDLIKYDEALLAAIIRDSGTINKWRKAAGFTERKRAKILSEDEILSALRKKANEIHAIPRSKMFRSGYPCLTTIIKHFGSWRRALVSAGLLNEEVSSKENG